MIAHVDRCERCAEVMSHLGRLDSAESGRYQLGRVLGAGAMGIVHEAWDPQLRRRVALKLVRPERADANARERMQARRVRSPRSTSILIDLDRAAEAIPLARRSTAIANAIGDRHALAFARGTLGEALTRTGDAPTGRSELAAALAILEQIQAPAETRVRVRFAYARSLWPIDPRRALDLAHAARADAQSVIDALAPDDPGRALVTRHQQRHIADIDRWLRGPR